MRMHANCITAAVALSLLWIFIMVAYLGLLDEPRAEVSYLRQRHHASTFNGHSELANINKNEVWKRMQKEQFSWDKAPEVAFDKFSIVQNGREQVIQFHCISVQFYCAKWASLFSKFLLNAEFMY